MNRWMTLATATALAGCAGASDNQAYVGRPVGEAVAALGTPDSVSDYADGSRVFSWSTSDMVVQSEPIPTPLMWTSPARLQVAPAEPSDEAIEQFSDSPILERFRPWPCTFNLVARWDGARNAWQTVRAARGGPGRGGRCGARASGG
jgi:hypothetical protein